MPEATPNILFLSTDQHHFQALSSAGNPHVRTPHMDRLLGRGAAFSKAYSPNPICGPCRASWFTGVMASEHGDIDNRKVDPRPDLPTLGEWLGEHSGYRRIFAGKWHAGDHPFRYSIRGFDVILSGINRNAMLGDPSIAAVSEAFIRNQTGQAGPWLLVTCLQQPHDICESIRMDSQPMPCLPYGLAESDLPPLPDNFDYAHPPSAAIPEPKNPEWTELNWRYYLWSYYRHVEMCDAQVGSILSALEETGQLETTLIVFTSDHGEALGSRRHVQKNNVFDESVRVPFAVCWPGRVPVVDDEDTLVSGLDIAPTICDYAGAPVPAWYRGISLKPYLDSLEAGQPQSPDRSWIVAETGANTGRMVRSADHKYICYSDGSELLFDMRDDPLEMHDLCGEPEHAGLLNQHRGWLRQWEASLDRYPGVEPFPCR